MQPEAIADLSRSGITPHDAERAGMFDVPDASVVCSDFKPLPALVIPYFETTGAVATYGTGTPFCRVRYLSEQPQRGFVAAKPQRYGQPRSSGTRAYFAPLIDWQAIADDTQQPVLITEGEKKGIAG